MFRVFLCLLSLSTSTLADLTKEQQNVTQAFGLNNRLNTPIAEFMMAFSTLAEVGLPIMRSKYPDQTIYDVFTLTQFNNWRNPEAVREAANRLKDPCITESGGINTASEACTKAMLAAYLMNKGMYEAESERYFNQLMYSSDTKAEAADVVHNMMDYYQNHETPQHKQDMFELQAIMNSP